MFQFNMIDFGYWMLKILHLHPEKKFNLFYFLLQKLWLLSIIINSIVVTINFFSSNKLTTNNIQTNSDLTLSIVQASVKLSVFALQKNNLMAHYFEAKTFWRVEEVKIKETYKAKMVKSYNQDLIPLKCFYWMAVFGQVLYFYNLSFNIDSSLVDFIPKKYRIKYYFMFFRFFAMVLQFFAGSFVTAFETLIVYSCLNLNVQFQMLSERFKTIVNEEVDKKTEFAICIKYHNFLLRYAERIKAALSFYFACTFLTTLYFLSSQLIFLVREPEIGQLAKAIAFYVLILFQYSLYCFPMSNLSDTMFELGNTVYNSKWYLCNDQSKKMIQFVMMRSHKPFNLTAGGLINIDKSNFTQVFKTSLSLYSLARVMEN